MKNMTVLYIFTFGYSLKTWQLSGTLDKELEVFKKIIKKFNTNFVLLTYGNNDDLTLNVASKNLKIIPIFKNKSIPKNKFVLLILSLIYVVKNRKLFKNVEIIQQNQLNGSWLALITKIFYKKPYILRTGYDTYRFSIYEKKSILKRLGFLFLTNLNFAFSDLITVTSNSDYIFSKNYFIKPKKIEVRPNWIIKRDIATQSERSFHKILSVGRLEDQKNYSKIINEFSNTEFEIDIVGTGNNLNSLRKLAKEKGAKVNFLGNRKNNDLNYLYPKYTFYISTSLFEGNPKTVLEAMSHGCVVLISNIDNHKELVLNSENGFLIDLSENFYKKLKKIIESKIDFNKVSLNASEFVFQNNNIEKLIDATHDDYLYLLKK